MIPVKLEDASAHQRLTYARDILNLELDTAHTDEQVMGLIRSAQPGNANIFVADEHESVQDASGRIDAPMPEIAGNNDRVAGSLGKDDPRALIRIPSIETEDGTGGADVAVGVNGRTWQLRRGEDLDVPWRVVEALKLTKEDIVRHDDVGDQTVRTVDRVPFQILQGPSAAEIAAWSQRVGNQFCP